MKLKLAGALVAATAAITMLAGCPTGTPTPTVEPFKYDPAAPIKGEVTYDGQPLDFASSNYTHKMEIKESGADKRLGQTSEIYEGKYFQFKNVTDGKSYQVISDYNGPEATDKASLNMIDLYVTEPATASAASTTANVKMDLRWNVNPGVDFNSDQTGSTIVFTHNALQNTGVQYQIQVVDPSDNSTIYSSAWKTGTSTTWNRKLMKRDTNGKVVAGEAENDSPTGNDVSAGNYSYRIKFRKEGGTYGGKNFYGETQAIPFKISALS